MTLDELITKLTELRDEEGVKGDALVLFAHQPHYPLQCDVSGPVVHSEDREEIESLADHIYPGSDYWEDAEDMADGQKRLDELRAKERPIVYLLEGSSRPWDGDRELSPYASRDLWDR